MRWIYEMLINRWLKKSTDGMGFKTDLHDEALNADYVHNLFKDKCKNVVGSDISYEIASVAKNKIDSSRIVKGYVAVSDIRTSAFKSCSFNWIFSNSTLDHFNEKKQIYKGLKELYRLLNKNGVLVITMDNPTNPLILIRNYLPHRLMQLFGFIPFKMGVTLSTYELIKYLESVGFSIQERTAIVHSPRLLSLRIGQILYKIGNKKLITFFLNFFKIFENLQKLPLRYFTGHFIAVKAVKVKTVKKL